MASASKKRLDRSKRSKKVKKAYKWKNKDIPKIAAKAIKMKKEAKKLGDYLLSGADYSQSDIDAWQAAGRKYKKFRESGYGIKDPVATRRKKVKTAVKKVKTAVKSVTQPYRKRISDTTKRYRESLKSRIKKRKSAKVVRYKSKFPNRIK